MGFVSAILWLLNQSETISEFFCHLAGNTLKRSHKTGFCSYFFVNGKMFLAYLRDWPKHIHMNGVFMQIVKGPLPWLWTSRTKIVQLSTQIARICFLKPFNKSPLYKTVSRMTDKNENIKT